MKFSEMLLQYQQPSTDVEVENVFQPYDRGASGAFVYRMNGLGISLPRLVVTTRVDDNASDKYTVQINTPRVCEPDPEQCVTARQQLGVDLVKVEMRFLASTSPNDRKDAIAQAIAALEELSDTVAQRNVIYT